MKTKLTFSPDPMPALLGEEAVAGKLNLSRRTLQAWRGQGRGPMYVKLGRAVRYRLEDIERFTAEGHRRSTAEGR
jgi:predicted DNA-binding transcriptional regulator AlpA